MIMKAGLITFHYAHHYGAQLQAYALRETIEELGVDCEIIDYVRQDTLDGNLLFKRGMSARSLLSNIHTALHYGSFKKRRSRFDDFVEKHMKLGPKRYLTIDELMADPPEYDLYVCGSDQIWNPLIFNPRNFDTAFFMPFAGEKRRIAYAPSFGIPEIPGDKKETLAGFLSGFSHLSARESAGADIIRNVSGRDAEVVLDPTLLRREADWEGLCVKPGIDRPYILCYFVSDPAPFIKTIESVAGRLKLPVVTLCGARKGIPGSAQKIYSAGPREFLGLFREAAYVCTNSFHGTVFSVIFRKDFASFTTDRGKEERNVNSRLMTLLRSLGLSDRLLSGGEDDPGRSGASAEIDYADVTAKLERERERSLNYLRNALYNIG
jgi:hypothetical protein